MSGNGQVGTAWGYAIEGQPPTMLRLALQSLRREGLPLLALPSCDGEACAWVREVAECLQRGDCHGAVLFCDDACLACCVTNKVAGVRAASCWTVAQAERAVHSFGANLLIVEAANRTFYECKQILRLGCNGVGCPAGVGHVLHQLEERRNHHGAEEKCACASRK